MSDIKVGDLVRHTITGKVGWVYEVHPFGVGVLTSDAWGAFGPELWGAAGVELCERGVELCERYESKMDEKQIERAQDIAAKASDLVGGDRELKVGDEVVIKSTGEIGTVAGVESDSDEVVVGKRTAPDKTYIGLFPISDIVKLEPGSATSGVAPKRATDIAAKASELVGGDRDRQHGAKHDNFNRIAGMWNAWLAIRKEPAAPLTAHDVGILMALMKLARTQSGAVNLDDYVDACGYSACAGEVAQAEST